VKHALPFGSLRILYGYQKTLQLNFKAM